MLRLLLPRVAHRQNPLRITRHQRGIHSRSKKAMELVAKGWSALQEVDRVIDYADLKDSRVIPLLRGAKENFELALEVDNMNTHARYWLAKMHFKYHVPGACKLIGAALLVEAANMGDPDALYDLGCHLRVENDYVQSDQQAFYYLEKTVDQLHPGALYLLGSVYLTGDCVKRDIASAMWCFHRASEKGHAGAAVAYGSLLLKGAEVPEAVSRFNSGRSPSTRGAKKRRVDLRDDPVKRAKEQFQFAAKAGCELGLRWLKMLADSEKTQLQWPGSYCDTQQSCCYPNNGKPVADFGIHGLWPNYNDGSYPSNCDSSDPFDESQIKDLIGNLRKNWPSLSCPSSNGESFWSHEWVKHGTCSESVFDQHGYFQATLSFKKQVNLLQILTNAGIEPNDNSYSLSSINKAIKEATGYTAGIECNTDESGNNQLYQIYLCVESSGTSLVECPVLPSGKCSSQIQFPSF